MADEMYYWITCSEDGDLSIEEMDADEVDAKIEDELADYDGELEPPFTETLPPDMEYFVGKMLIKGRIVVPRTVSVVKKMTVREAP